MARETFYDTLSSGRYSKVEFENLSFKMEEKGTEYRIILEGSSSDPIDSIVSGRYRIRTLMGNHDITGTKLKKDLLNLLFHNIEEI
jgi:hypothetical protein